MTSHVSLLVLFAFFVSLIFAVLMRDDAREQLTLGAKLLGSFVGAGLALGWLLYPLPIQGPSGFFAHSLLKKATTLRRGRPPRAPQAFTTLLSLWLLVILYMAGIFYLSSLTSPPTPEQVSDKTLHFALYGGLALVTLRAVARGRWEGVTRGAVAVSWLIATAYGVTDEWHQRFTEARTPDLADVGADALGAALGAITAGAWGIIRRL